MGLDLMVITNTKTVVPTLSSAPDTTILPAPCLRTLVPDFALPAPPYPSELSVTSSEKPPWTSQPSQLQTLCPTNSIPASLWAGVSLSADVSGRGQRLVTQVSDLWDAEGSMEHLPHDVTH